MSTKKRRRVVRKSEVDYDRHADSNGPRTSMDADRLVPLDEEDAGESEPSNTLEFYLEQRPPHYS